MSATQLLNRPPTECAAARDDGEEEVAIAILSETPINKFGLLMLRESVRIALKVNAEDVSGFYGNGLAGYGFPFVKCVGAFAVILASVKNRQVALKALHEVVPEKALPYEIAWFDKAERYWRTAHSTQVRFGLLRFDRFLTQEIRDEFAASLSAPDDESEKFWAALKHFVEAAKKSDAGGE